MPCVPSFRRLASLPLRAAFSGAALAGALALGGCGSIAQNRSLESLNQPVVQRTTLVMDVNTLPGGGLDAGERERLGQWFAAMKLRYGDRVAVDDPAGAAATRSAVESVAARFGMLVNDTAPVTAGYVGAGSARVVITRITADVPGCPDWSTKSDFNFNNATASGYGCAVNGNMAAMVADKEHLVHGATGQGETVAASGAKAIENYRSGSGASSGGSKKGGGN